MRSEVGPWDPVINFVDHYNRIVGANISLIKNKSLFIGKSTFMGSFFQKLRIKSFVLTYLFLHQGDIFGKDLFLFLPCLL